MRILKAVSYLLLGVVLLVAAYAYVLFEYGTPVSRIGVSEIHAVSSSSGGLTNVKVDGFILSSSAFVSGVNQHQEGHCIVVTVRQALVHGDRRDASFHLNIVVPDDVDEIAFATPSNVIWHR
ncbi:hypothetical protein [Granulicella sp. S156]|uniref:hypothetical protein n=1 Tax=Granulicella sp. S156 TaxID=1747224 RepID=UPI00131C58CC|nr:hypothetical protein [Granulicella sp. S156]